MRVSKEVKRDLLVLYNQAKADYKETTDNLYSRQFYRGQFCMITTVLKILKIGIQDEENLFINDSTFDM